MVDSQTGIPRAVNAEMVRHFVPASHYPVYAVEVWSSYCDHQVESIWGGRGKAEARLRKILAGEVEADAELDLRVEDGEIREFRMEL